MPKFKKSLVFLAALGVGLAIGLIACVACFEIISPDLFWHLKMGEDLLKHGLSPFFDHYSFTYLDAPIKRNAWPFEVIISWFYTLGGWKGIALFRFLVWGAGVGFLLKLFRNEKIRGSIQILGVLFFLFIIAYHSEPRPDLLSLPLELLTLLICIWWRRTDSVKAVAILSVLFVFWSNYHVSSVFGYVIAGAFMIEKMATLIIKKEEVGPWMKFGLTVLTINLAGLLNHDLLHPILSQAALSPKWTDYIVEYVKRPYSDQEFYLQIYWLLLGFTIPALLLKREWAGLVISLVVGYKTWSMSKLFPHLIVMTVPFVCSGLNFYIDVVLKKKMTVVRNFLFVMGAGTSCILTWQLLEAIFFKPVHPIALGISSWFFPVDTVDYFKARNFSGRILNEYPLGGYILFNLAPGSSIYIDGRTSVLYPLEFMERYTNLLTSTESLKAEVKKYGVDWVIGSLEKPDELVDTSLNSGLFSLEYVGENSILLSHSGNFPIATVSFIHPECLEKANPASLQVELTKARETMPARSPLITYLDFAEKYFSNPDRIEGPDQNLLKSSYTSRLAAYIEDHKKNGRAALFYYGQILHPSQDDKINWAEADCKYNRCEKAEVILNSVTAAGLRVDHIYRAYRLLEKIRLEKGLQIFTEERLQRNRAKVEKYLEPGVEPPQVDWCGKK